MPVTRPKGPQAAIGGCCWNAVRAAVLGVDPPAEPPITNMCIFSSNDFTLTGNTIMYIGGVINFGYNSARTLAEALQLTYAQSGVSYFGSGYSFWIAIPEGDTPPTNWQVEEDPFGNPGVFSDVVFSSAGICFDQDGYRCLEFNFTIPDASTYNPYLLSWDLGTNEFVAFQPYDQAGTDSIIELTATTTFGSQATSSFSLSGNDITITIYNVPHPSGITLTSSDFGGGQQIDNGTEIPCP